MLSTFSFISFLSCNRGLRLHLNRDDFSSLNDQEKGLKGIKTYHNKTICFSVLDDTNYFNVKEGNGERERANKTILAEKKITLSTFLYNFHKGLGVTYMTKWDSKIFARCQSALSYTVTNVGMA